MKSSGSEVISLNPDLPELIAAIFFLGGFLECHRVHLNTPKTSRDGFHPLTNTRIVSQC